MHCKNEELKKSWKYLNRHLIFTIQMGSNECSCSGREGNGILLFAI
jgi:hypothetical protein